MDRIITVDVAETLRKEFSTLRDDVHLVVFTKKGKNDKFNDFSVNLCRELSEVSKKIRWKHHDGDSKEAQKYGITTSPVILINPNKYRIQFSGAPLGEEGRSLIAAITMVSHGHGVLSEEPAKRVRELKDPREVLVFVSPTCPYCPQQTAYAVSAAVTMPDMVSVNVVEMYENRDLAERYSVVSVPQTIVNGNVVATGIQPEEVFVDSLFSGAPVEMKIAPVTGKVIKKDVVIVGAGPAGLTAAIYAERAGLKSVILEKGSIGGQIAVTPIVENYPGYTRIPGKTLTDMMAQQALQYTDMHQGEAVVDIEKKGEGNFLVMTTSNKYDTKAVILATGAEHKKLGVPGEKRFFGRGVSYCATCDGYFFKDNKKVIMVGGGNSAVTEVLYLESIGVDVTLVHRRGELRAEERLQKSLMDRKIPVLWNTLVEEILGNAVVNAVKLKNTEEGKSSTMPIDGIFISIGYVPVNDLAVKLNLELIDGGYIRVDDRQRTSTVGLYAAGDVTGGIKQIVTAVGQGSVAALTIFEDLMNPYWKGKGDMF
jgi:thioredoxin reductase (NADPH)